MLMTVLRVRLCEVRVFFLVPEKEGRGTVLTVREGQRRFKDCSERFRRKEVKPAILNPGIKPGLLTPRTAERRL